MSLRQPDLFFGDKSPPRTPRPERAYRRSERCSSKPFAWESMGSWVRHMNHLFALETPSSEHYTRTRATARELTIDRIRECRHDDDLGRCEDMLVQARAGWLYGLDRAFTRSERGELLVEVRNRRALLAKGRDRPRQKGPRFDPTRMPIAVLDRLIQIHPDLSLVELLRAERSNRRAASDPTS